MQKILLIATGGTIASKSTSEGFTPMISSEEILQYVPAIKELCEVDAIQPMNLDSTNVGPDNWLIIASCIEKNYDSYDGFVVTHGTDTMAYTAAALSYLIQNSKKPIVITGSQKSIYLENTDAKMNLMNSFIFAADPDSHGVHIIFDGKAIIGTRARKKRTKSFNAFSSIDFPDTAAIRDGKILRYIRDIPYSDTPTFYHHLNPRVFLLKLIPGISADIFNYLKEHYDAVIIEGFGVGGVPHYEGSDFVSAIEDFINAGKTILMTTQVPYEGSDMAVYEVGYRVKEDFNVIEAYDMTIETTVTKLMWILAQTNHPHKIKELFYQPICFDLVQ